MDSIILGKIIIGILFTIFAVLVIWFGKLAMPINFSDDKNK
ncbi:MAG: hypothetical protein PHC64_10005 [Candidatus Gastranaerophilales bacterium]|nr:hypothetical protein [Candidatus Gastranaerophilales bacterium]